MKVDLTHTGANARFRLQGDRSGASYTVEGLATLALNQAITPETEVAHGTETHFRPVKDWPFADAVFRPKPKLGFKPPLTPKGYAPDHLEITGAEELRELIRRDPNDVRVTMLLNHITEQRAAEGRPLDELMEEYFARRRGEIAGKPRDWSSLRHPPAPAAIKDVTPGPDSLIGRLKGFFAARTPRRK